MGLLIAAILNGVATGALWGLLGFPIVFLLRATGVINFAAGAMGMFVLFSVYDIHQLGVSLWAALAIGIPIAVVLGVAIFELCISPRSRTTDKFSLTIRTIGVLLLLEAVADTAYGNRGFGQPFTFPRVIPAWHLRIGSAFTFTSLEVSQLAVAGILALLASLFFRRSKVGLLWKAVAEDPETARLLGVRVRTLTLVAWIATALIATLVAIFLVPTTLLSSTMMDGVLPYALVAAVIGGTSALFPVFVGGVIVGVAYSTIAVYSSSDIATFGSLILLVLVLRFKPNGILGSLVRERL